MGRLQLQTSSGTHGPVQAFYQPVHHRWPPAGEVLQNLQQLPPNSHNLCLICPPATPDQVTQGAALSQLLQQK